MSEPTLKAIAEFIYAHGHPPQVRELARIIGLPYSTARLRLRDLERKNFIRRVPKSPRGIAITHSGLAAIQRDNQDMLGHLIRGPHLTQ